MFFMCLYRSPSQNRDKFSDICKDFSILLNNINDHRPSCSVMVISMVNARNGIRLIKIMQLEMLYRLIHQLQVTVS